MPLPNRYEGRPILVFIENYGLAVLGHLPPDKEARISKLVQHTWGGGEDWMQTVRSQLDWRPSIDQTIRKNWQRYQDAARSQAVPESAAEFAMMFADAIEKEVTT